MSKLLMYSTELGEEISQQQATQLRIYYITVYEDNRKVRFEAYSNGVLVNTSYFINSQDEIAPILLINSNASFSLETIVGNYKVHEGLSYQNRKLTSKRKSVEELNFENTICFQVYDTATDTPIHSRTEKNYYNQDGISIYSFYYNEDGSCFSIDKDQEYQTDFFAHEIGVNPDVDFTWQGFEYYQFSWPLVPIDM